MNGWRSVISYEMEFESRRETVSSHGEFEPRMLKASIRQVLPLLRCCFGFLSWTAGGRLEGWRETSASDVCFFGRSMDGFDACQMKNHRHSWSRCPFLWIELLHKRAVYMTRASL